jgi:tetratricopeptide (TPR) repeat protein
LAEAALARDEIATAEERFRRELQHRPASARAHVGLGRIALTRADLAGAQEHFAAAASSTDAAPDTLGDALVGLADVAVRQNDPAAAREALTLALARQPWRSDAHVRLADISGAADHRAAVSGDAAIVLAEDHPYDPWALLGAGRALAEIGADEAAVESLERAVWLGDLDAQSAAFAVDLLAQLSESWRDRPIVPVHLYADEAIRAEVGWKFRLRTALLSAANGLAGPIGVRLVTVSVSGFDDAGVPSDLESIHAAFTQATGSPPGPGILAAFTARPFPEYRAETKRGLAEFLGRRLTVRFPPHEWKSRALAHEILHLYGAMHVSDDIESLMNPSGDSLKLDSLSHRTVTAMRWRSFETGRLDQDVLPRVDLHEVIDAYVDVLAANLTFRQLGIDEIVKRGRHLRGAGAVRVHELKRQDPHLADVARIVAALMLSDGRRVEALSLFETAAQLYGRDTRRGAAAARHAEELRQALLEEYDL